MSLHRNKTKYIDTSFLSKGCYNESRFLYIKTNYMGFYQNFLEKITTPKII